MIITKLAHELEPGDRLDDFVVTSWRWPRNARLLVRGRRADGVETTMRLAPLDAVDVQRGQAN